MGKEFDFKTFEAIAKLRQEGLKKVMARFLNSHYTEVTNTKTHIFAKGDIPIALVAHLDTVFVSPPSDVFYDPEKQVVWGLGGLGADDRAGVYAIIQIINSGLKPHIILTTDEEIGGTGAITVAYSPNPFTGLKYLIELDRRGSNDCVFYNCENDEFTHYVEKFGFQTSFGTYSDIYEICPNWQIAGVNLSIGYRNEHSEVEMLYVNDMLSTIDKVIAMLNDANNVPKPFKYGNKSYGVELSKCDHCHKYHLEEEVFPVADKNGLIKFYCGDCVAKLPNLKYCSTCGFLYEDCEKCPICAEEKKKK